MTRPLRAATVVVVALVILSSEVSCNRDAKPNCTRMRACCAALKTVEDGLPKEHEILCAHDPEFDDGCVETVKDIARFTPSKSLPQACTLER